MTQQTEAFANPGSRYFEQQVKPFLLNNGPLLITITVFLVGYFIAGQIYPTMQKPQVFFNLFINNASLLIISIGMTFVVLLERDRSFGGFHPGPDLGCVGGVA